MKVKTRQIETFEDLGVWQIASDLALKIYKLTRSDSFAQDLALKDQIQRTAITIPSIIAEGFERGGDKEFARFLLSAKASTGKLRSYLHLAEALNFINEPTALRLKENVDRLSRKLAALIVYLRKDS